MKNGMVVFVILVILALPGFCRSEEEGEEKEALVTMEEVVVTGTRSVREVEKIPAHVAIITTDQIKASGAQSVPDVLRSLGGVMVRDLNGNANMAGNETKAEFDEGEWAWNLGLAYSFMPESKVYGRVYRSFRYPAVDEYTNLFTGTVNDSLNQETGLGFEAGVRLLMFSKLIFNLRAYLLEIDDEIAWNNITNQNENLDETRHMGGELDFRYQPVHYLALYCNAGYTNAEFTEGSNDGKKIPLVPEWKANTGLELKPGFGLKYRLQYNYVGERFFGSNYSNSQKKMGNFHVVDMYFTYQYKAFEVFLNANNIFNEKYSDFAWFNSFDSTFNYYPMPEAVYYGGIRIAF